VVDVRIKDLAFGPFREVRTWPQYYANGYRFHTKAYNSTKSTMNSGVCIKGSNYNDFECDYFGLLEEVIELQFFNSTDKRTRVVLFKCDWFDPKLKRGCNVHRQYGIFEINHKRRFDKYEPFVLAQQAQQVYFTEYASKKKEKANWWVVCKTKARSTINALELAYQDDEVEVQCETSLDDVESAQVGEEEEIVVDDDVDEQFGEEGEVLVDDDVNEQVEEEDEILVDDDVDEQVGEVDEILVDDDYESEICSSNYDSSEDENGMSENHSCDSDDGIESDDDNDDI